MAVTHDAGTVLRGAAINVSDVTRNNGDAAATSFRVGIYASTDSQITTSDTLLGFRTVAQLGAGEQSNGGGRLTIDLPAGTWFLGAIADDQGSVTEGNENDNAMLSTSHESKVVVSEPPKNPDLVVTSFTHTPGRIVKGSSVTFSDVVKNQGDAAASSYRIGIYAARSLPVTTANGTLLGFRSVASHGVGAESRSSGAVRIDLDPGTWFIAAIADDQLRVTEKDETNNTLASQSFASQLIVDSPPREPDLVVSALTHSVGTVQRGSSLAFADTVNNVDTGAAGSFRVGIYASTNNVITTGDTLLGSRTVASLAGGTASRGSGTLVINLPPGTYYIGCIVDDLSQVAESQESNNTRLSSSFNSRLIVTSPPQLPDLTMTAATHGLGTVQQGGSVFFSSTVKNLGPGSAGAFRVGIYASTNSIISPSDTLLGWGDVSALGAGSSALRSGNLVINLAPGTYYVGAFANYQGTVSETSTANNGRLSSSFGGKLIVTSVPRYPDLILTAMTHSARSVPYGSTVFFSTTVKNQGTTAAGSFRVGIYASTNNIISPSDTLIGYATITSLGVNSISINSGWLRILFPRGTYYIGAYADDQFRLVELLESNNSRLSSSFSSLLTVL